MDTAKPTSLEFTGERYTPECVREMLYEHYARYAMAQHFVAGKTVLDCASGEGYGSALLAQKAAHVIGVDIAADAIQHAKARYPLSNLEFHCASALDLPLANHSVDTIVSFETLEHMVEHQALLASFKRVLKADGTLLISTPDKYRYTDLSGYQNEFHVKELYRAEFEALLGQHFRHFKLFGQSLLFQSHIWDLNTATHQAHAARLQEGAIPRMDAGFDPTPMYFIAVASDSQAVVDASTAQLHLFADQIQSIYAHYNFEIRKGIQAGQVIQALEARIKELEARLQA
jgi:2-polyprenyl-3-methyl-5-hydroxy-6-metoxy-1,4-benzoquinol methylase